jgi:DNA-binding transcriptional regulator YiaG
MAGMDGAELKKIRKTLGLSLAQVARQIEVSPRTWARWEAGDQAIPGAALRLFLILNGLDRPDIKKIRGRYRSS